MRYRKRPVEVDAYQLDRDPQKFLKFVTAHGGKCTTDADGHVRIWVNKSFAWCTVNRFGWAIAEADGDGVYPCTREQFAATYELAEEVEA